MIDRGKILNAAGLGPDFGNDLVEFGEKVFAFAGVQLDGGENDDHK
jgi:hypothetical protein